MQGSPSGISLSRYVYTPMYRLFLKMRLILFLLNSFPELSPVISYQTFSHSDKCPKFRLVFITDDVINDPDIRCAIVERLVSIFPQSDRACTNANRLFLGTNKEVVLHSKNARISVENILAIPCREQPKSENTKKKMERQN